MKRIFTQAKLLVAAGALLLIGEARAQDPSPLQIFCHSDLIVWTCGDGPVVVDYSTPPVIGDCASNAVVTCFPPPGTAFPIGTNEVMCTAADTCGGQVRCTFNIIVARDTFPPVLTPPSDIVVHTGNPAGTHVFYGPFGIDDEDEDIAPVFVPPSGSFFPLGTNQVLFYAVDQCGNSNGVTFTVEARKAKVNGGLLPTGGMQLDWESDEGLECVDDLNSPWEPVPNPSKPFNFLPANGTAKFFRPASGVDNGIPLHSRAEIAYVSVGLQAPEFTPGAGLDRLTDDDEFATGSLIHTPQAGGSQNTWSGVISIPFKFWFYGKAYTKLCVSKNGLITFSTNVANTPVGNASDPRKLPNRFLPDHTIVGFQSPHASEETGYSVRAYLEGAAPNRQVWIVWHHLFKPNHGKTHTGVVLEESSNRILMADMYAEFPNSDGPTFNPDTIDPFEGPAIAAPLTGTIACGVQRDTNAFTQIPASPNIDLVNGAIENWDNDFYLFKPYQVGRQVNGDGAQALGFIDQMALDRTRQSNIPGTTVAVTYKGRLIYNKAFGFANVEKNIEMMPHHRACIGSVSKVITAAGIFKLMELGQLDVNDGIMEPHLWGSRPWFLQAFNIGMNNGVHSNASLTHLNNITLEHLMNHTSGYRRSADQVKAADLFNGGVYSTSTYTNGVQWFMATQRFLTNAPGLLESYSNHGPGQLGALIQFLTGMVYQDFINEYLLKPNGVKNMRMLKPQFLQQHPLLDARRYSWYSSGSPHPKNPFHGQPAPNTYDATLEGIGSQGAWTGTARDLARFMAATDRLNNHSDLLPPHLLSIMESNSMPSVTSFAKGWAKNETTGRLRHNGNIGYGASSVQKNTNGVNVAVVCNTGNASFCDNFADAIFSAMTPDVLADIPQFYDLFGAEVQLQANP